MDAATAELNARTADIRKAVEAVGTELQELRDQEKEHILSSYSCLRYHSTCCELRQYACRSRNTFYLTGWVPAAAVREVEGKLAQFPGQAPHQAEKLLPGPGVPALPGDVRPARL